MPRLEWLASGPDIDHDLAGRRWQPAFIGVDRQHQLLIDEPVDGLRCPFKSIEIETVRGIKWQSNDLGRQQSFSISKKVERNLGCVSAKKLEVDFIMRSPGV